MSEQINIKERLSYAHIKQKTIAANVGVGESFVCQVLNGATGSDKVMNEARRLLNEVLERDQGLEAFFKTRGI